MDWYVRRITGIRLSPVSKGDDDAEFGEIGSEP
jgi:hypothetical protein